MEYEEQLPARHERYYATGKRHDTVKETFGGEVPDAQQQVAHTDKKKHQHRDERQRYDECSKFATAFFGEGLYDGEPRENSANRAK